MEQFGNWPISQLLPVLQRAKGEVDDALAKARQARLICSLAPGIDLHVDFCGVFGHSTTYRLMSFAMKWLGLPMPPLDQWLQSHRGQQP